MLILSKVFLWVAFVGSVHPTIETGSMETEDNRQEFDANDRRLLVHDRQLGSSIGRSGCLLLDPSGMMSIRQYDPVGSDSSKARKILLSDRPADSPAIVEVNDVGDIVKISIEYQHQMECWQLYAVKLENWIKNLENCPCPVICTPSIGQPNN